METEKLLHQLVKKNKAVRKVITPGSYSLLLSIIAFSYISILVFYLGIRPDIEDKSDQLSYIIEISLAAITLISSAYAASVFSVPDNYQIRHIKWLSIVAPTLFSAYIAIKLFYQLFLHDIAYITKTGNNYSCAIDMLIFSILPIGAAILSLRKNASTSQSWCGAMISLCAVSISYIALRIIEPNDMMTHIVFWHYLPMLAISFIGIIIGKLLLKW